VTALVGPAALRGPRITRLHVATTAAASVVFTLVLFSLTPFAGRAAFVVTAFVVFVGGQTSAVAVVEGRRHAVNRLATTLLASAAAIALLPLVAVLAFTVSKGASAISVDFLTHSMNGVGPLDTNGGVYHAIVGTLQQVAIAGVIAIPLGLLTAIYLVEYGRGRRLAAVVRFVVDVMTGIPSIVAGLFVFAFWVLALQQGFSGLAAALSLSILMLPVVVRSCEEMLKLVPDSLREASYALGVPRWRTIVSVVLPAASSGITTGVMLAVARVTGETAPLLLTAFGFDAIKTDPLHGPQSAIPLFVFDQAQRPSDAAAARAWAAALTLIVIVLALYAVARLATGRNRLVRG
jgi:phosphate transport system permease protein